MAKYTALIREDKEVGGYWCEIKELRGCYTQGETVEELLEHAVEAVQCYLDTDEVHEIVPVFIGRKKIKV